MALGYDGKLYILAFDHRGSFVKRFGIEGQPSPEEAARISDGKHLIFEGLVVALERGAEAQVTGGLVDEQFGGPTRVPEEIKERGIKLAMPVEKSGQDEFDFEYGDEFGAHIEAFDPSFAKVLVRYNPEGDQTLNRRQAARLRRLSQYLHDHSRSRFMFELLVPPEQRQVDGVGGDTKAYDRQIRPWLMVQAIQELQDAQVEPDIWKVEGLDRYQDCETIVATARRGGRDHVGCIILGRGEDARKVRDWLTTAARVPGFIGFAVGRTVFWDALVAWRARKTTREEAVAEIARRYKEFVDTFETARALSATRTE